MAKSLKRVMTIEKTSPIDCGWGLTAEMTYKPALVTEDLDEGITGESDAHQAAGIICAIVSAWELTGPVPLETVGTIAEGSIVAEDAPVPLDPQVVRHLPIPLLKGIIAGLVQDALPKPTRTPSA